jgi:hypothetical protein
MPVPTRNHDWLALTVEAPIDPALTIRDPVARRCFAS